jgi:hypothetical protein
MSAYSGSCHCGAVRFRVQSQIRELTTCDCSLCVKRNAVMARVSEDALTMLQGQGELTLYQWNTRLAKHYFCRRCGIYVFHRKRAMPDHFGINVYCLEGFDVSSIPIRATEGANMTVAEPAANPDWPGPRVE